MDVSFWQIVVLAIVQGVTEFLPISSDGHLVVAAVWLSPNQSPADLDVGGLVIVLHLGTLLSILVFYWRRVLSLLCEDRRVLWLLFLATLPAVVVGLPLKIFASHAVLENPLVAGFGLIATGLVLLWGAGNRVGDVAYQKLTWGSTLALGFAQAAAILPGLSRSGMTISSGLRLGMAPRSAATFSFLMAIPAIAGAGVLEAGKTLLDDASIAAPWGYLVTGAAISFVVGLGSLAILVRCLESGRFQWFAWWCIPFGACVVVWRLMA